MREESMGLTRSFAVSCLGLEKERERRKRGWEMNRLRDVKYMEG
jgi:hypothetical protein